MTGNPSFRFADAAGKPPQEAGMFWSGGPVEVAERTWFVSFVSGVTAFETDEGLVLVDASTEHFSSHLARQIRELSSAPVHTAIYTHGHIDHAFGLGAFLADGQAPPRVIAQRSMRERFDRYARTPGHNQAINARQFGGTVDFDLVGGDGITWHAPQIPPDTYYDDELEIDVGGVTFLLHHARGETDDHTWVYCPDRGVLCPGDLVIWAVPNAGNPQKAQRYPWDWAAALRRMAALEPRCLCPGHGGPVTDDPSLVRRILVETADYLDALVDQTVAAMEAGSPPHVDIVRSVQPPPSDAPWLQPTYDEAEFIVRSVIRYYGGWYTGRPSELKPAGRAEVGTAVSSLAGGPAALAEVAAEKAAAGDLTVACHLADFALEAAPDDPHVHEIVADLYDQRAARETSLMAINLFRSAAAYARAGRPFA